MDMKNLRSRLGLSQEEIARIIKVSKSQVSRIENGICELSLAQFGILVRSVNLSESTIREMLSEAADNAPPPRIRSKKKAQG